ncbi:hypothetical protein VNI00_004140 [Paramarasmius palmivorus]|uniref:F-box domain-containing protein n=1 Tax=Paramarasmius palmivorus TaxID=297713 RepID=A0AAW0DK19_9AGAR
MAETVVILKEESDLHQRLGDEITHLRELTKTLEQEQVLLEQTMSERRAWLSPVRKLPPEILDQIFWQYVRSFKFALKVFRKQKQNHLLAPPMLLSQVSSYWRMLVSSRPDLWSSISVDVYTLELDLMTILPLYFQRAKETPLNLRIVDSHQGRGEDFEIIRRPPMYLGLHGYSAYVAMMKEISRCKILSLYVDSELLDGIKSEFKSRTLSFPHLRTLYDNTGTWNPTDSQNGWFWRPIRNAAPKLTEVTSNSRGRVDSFAYHQITMLNLGFVDLLPLVRILSISPNLQTLRVDGVFGEMSTEGYCAPSNPPLLSHLRKLSLGGVDLDSLSFILRSFTAPTLTSLQLEIDSDPPNVVWNIQSLVAFIARSSCQIQVITLNVGDTNLTLDSIAELLEATPQLVSLQVRVNEGGEHGITDEWTRRLLSKLTIAGSEPVLVPRLRRLRVAEGQNDMWPWLNERVGGVIIGMAETRSRTWLTAHKLADRVCPLETIKLAFSTGYGDVSDCMDKLETLEKDGMDIDLAWSGDEDDEDEDQSSMFSDSDYDSEDTYQSDESDFDDDGY